MSVPWSTNESPLVHFFATCGLEVDKDLKVVTSGFEQHDDEKTPLQCHYEAGTICHFPEERDGTHYDSCAMSRLAIPNGIRFCTKSELPSQPTSHCFLITQEDGRQLYGTAVNFFQIVKDQTLLQAVKSMQDIWQINHATVDVSSMQTRWWHTEREDLYISKSLVLLLNGPYPHFGMDFLTQILAASQLEDGTQLVQSHIHFLLSQDQIQPGYILTLQGAMAPVNCIRPHDFGIPIVNFHLRHILTIFDMGDILTIMALLLVERQILLVSEDLHSLTAVAECFGAVLSPFEWQHVFAPILPCQQMDLLDAPVPFIMGLLLKPEEATRAALDLSDEVSLVNADTGKIDVSKQNLLKLPEDRALCKWLEKFMPRPSLVEVDDDVEDTTAPKPSWKSPRSYLSSGIVEPVCLNNDLFNSDMTLEYFSHVRPRPMVSSKVRHTFGTMSSSASGDVEEDMSISESDDGDLVLFSMNTATLSLTDYPRPELAAQMVAAQGVHKKELELNTKVQQAFFKYFQTILSDYQIYLVEGDDMNDINSSVSFDTVAFLSDRPAAYHNFFSQFAATQAFSVFTEIRTLEKFGVLPPARLYFDECLQANMRTRAHHNGGSVSFSLRKVVNQLISSQKPADMCSMIVSSHSFSFSPSTSYSKLKDLKRDSLHTFLNTTRPGASPSVHSSNLSKPRNKSSTGPVSHEVVTRRLLHEAKSKVRRLTLAKMGREGFMLSIGFNDCQVVMNQEEQIGIIGICDLFERIWSHGVKVKKRGQRSMLWSHLVHFMGHCENLDAQDTSPLVVSPQRSPKIDTRRFSFGTKKTNQATTNSLNRSASVCVTKTNKIEVVSSGEQAVRNFCLGKKRKLSLQLVDDIRRVLRMPEIKSDNGCARAFIRLALEKKLLASYLEKLMEDFAYLVEHYREYAFVRQEDVAEQLIGHLLILTTVNISSFSNCYLSTSMIYTVIVIGKAGTPPLSMRLFGSSGEVQQFEIPPNTMYFQVKNTNIGCVEGALVSWCEKNAIVSKVVDMFVFCDRTETCFRLDIRRWTNIDDVSTKMVLCAEEVCSETLLNVIQSEHGSETATPVRSINSQASLASTHSMNTNSDDNDAEGSQGCAKGVSAVENIAEAINLLAKYVDGVQTDCSRSLLQLIWGRQGLCMRIVEALSDGLKATRVLRSKRCVWDYLDLVRTHPQSSKGQDEKAWGLFCSTFKVLDECDVVGKHTKALLFVCEGLRLNCLKSWLSILHKSPAVAKVYLTSASLRSKEVYADLAHLLAWCSGITLDVPPAIVALEEENNLQSAPSAAAKTIRYW